MSLLDFGFTAPRPARADVHKCWTFKPPAIEIVACRMIDRQEVDFDRFTATRAGYNYMMSGPKCPCGAGDYHGGGGPYDHDPMPMPSGYGPGAVRYDGGVVTLDMTKMASHIIYRFQVRRRRGKIAGVSLKVYSFGRTDAEFACTVYLEKVLRPGDMA